LNYLLQADLFTSNAAKDSIAGGDGIDTLLVGTSGTTFTVASGDAWTRVTDVEVIKAAANSAAVSITLAASAATAGVNKVDLSLTTATSGNVIDVSAFTVATDTVLIGSSATGKVAITGGAGVDNITAAFGGSTITGNAGADIINGGASGDTLVYAATADLFADSALVDSVKGGADAYVAGSNQGDIIKVGTAATAFTIANDDSWARATGIESIVAVANSAAVTIALDATAQGAGIKEVDLALVTGTSSTAKSSINVSEFTTGVKLIGATATGVVDIIGGLGVDTITGAAGGGSITGGAGNDAITLESSTAVDTVVLKTIVGTSSDSGYTSVTGTVEDTGGDTITNFKVANDFINIVATNITGAMNTTAAGVVAIGTATGSLTDGTAGTFATTVGLFSLNGDSDYTDAGDIAVNFASATGVADAAALLAVTKFTLTGTNAAESIYGGDNADYLDGGAGDDVLMGRLSNSVTGANTLVGGNGADYIQGQSSATTWTSGDVAKYTDVIFLGSDTSSTGVDLTSGSWTGKLYDEGTDTITTTGMNAQFATTFAGALTSAKFASIFNAANIVDGWFGADTIVASTAKDVFLFQTGITARTSLDGGTTYIAAADRGTAISGKTIQKFQIGTDAIAATNYVGGGDNVFVGSAAAATTFNASTAATSSPALLASSNGWTWTLDTGKTDAGTLSYVGGIGASNQTYANFDIHLVGVQGTIVSVDSFFPVA
jgi:serralysin